MGLSRVIYSKIMIQSYRFAIAQMDPTVGDYSQNTVKIINWIREAAARKADLIVFPEGALCGYPVWDLANKKQFVAEGLKQLRRVVTATRGKDLAVVLGFIDQGTGSPAASRASSYNALAWIENGKIRKVYHKQLLPTYDVFLEEIFFQAGHEDASTVSWKDRKVGLTICEDIWDAPYKVKPLRALKKRKADLVINVSASPYYRGVAEARDALLKGHATRYGFPILYVNQAGGQDDLLFDGRSVFCDACGTVLFRAPAFTEGLFVYDWKPSPPRRCSTGKAREVPLPEWTGQAKETYDALVMGLRDYFQKNGFKKTVIGLSGGIDSALVATLAVDALGADAVKGVTMPGPFSSEGSWKDAESLAKALGIAFEVRPIRQKYKDWLQVSGFAARERPTVAMENLQARLRGLELMFLSNDEGMLVLTTGNKSELAVGYCTLYGDMAGGLAVIGDVYKTDVYRMAWYRNTIGRVIPEATLTKAPSAELRPGQKDEDSLPPYEILDEVLYLYIEKNLSREEILRKTRGRIAAAVVADVIRKVDHNEYKRRQTPPILRVSEKAWFGRRMPITNRFQG